MSSSHNILLVRRHFNNFDWSEELRIPYYTVELNLISDRDKLIDVCFTGNDNNLIVHSTSKVYKELFW
jgi:hypothetical protein